MPGSPIDYGATLLQYSGKVQLFHAAIQFIEVGKRTCSQMGEHSFPIGERTHIPGSKQFLPSQ
jgi:hypothetical protein